MKQHLRVIGEIALIGTVALSAGMLLPFIASGLVVGLANLLSFINVVPEALVDWSMRLTGVFSIVGGPAFLFGTAYIYGLKRVLKKNLIAVLIGWSIGWMLYSSVMGIATNSMFPPKHKAVVVHSHWWNWPLWLGWLFLFALLPALVTMWGQRVRLRRTA